MQSMELIGPIGRDEEHVSLVQSPGEVGKEVHGRLIRPLEIIDRDDEGLLSSEIAEHARERTEGAVADVGIGDGEVALGLRESWHIPHAAERIDERPEGPTGLRLGALAYDDSRA